MQVKTLLPLLITTKELFLSSSVACDVSAVFTGLKMQETLQEAKEHKLKIQKKNRDNKKQTADHYQHKLNQLVHLNPTVTLGSSIANMCHGCTRNISLRHVRVTMLPLCPLLLLHK